MSSSSVVLIPAGTPVLEALARAIEEGAAEESGSAPRPPVHLDGDGSFEFIPGSGLAIVGWRADQTPPAALAGRTLATLAKSCPGPIRVSFFEASLRGAVSTPPNVAALIGAFRDLSNLSFGSSPELFVIDRGTKGEFIGPLELARARAWGAMEYSRWRSALPSPAVGDPRADSDAAAPRSVPWCGATE